MKTFFVDKASLILTWFPIGLPEPERAFDKLPMAYLDK